MPIGVNDIWIKYSKPIKGFILKKINSEQDADDIMQEVFIKIYNNISSLKDDKKVNAWVYQITKNAISDYYRRQGKSVKLVELSENLTNDLIEDTSFNYKIAECLEAMIDNMKDEYKQAILLTEFGNLTQIELSKKMGISISGAKSRVQRAKKKLKKTLLNCCNFEFDHFGNVIYYEHKSNNCKYC